MFQVVWGCLWSVHSSSSLLLPNNFPVWAFLMCWSPSGKSCSMGSVQAAVPSGHVPLLHHIVPHGLQCGYLLCHRLLLRLQRNLLQHHLLPLLPFPPCCLQGSFLTLLSSLLSLFGPFLDTLSQGHWQLLFAGMQSSTPGGPIHGLTSFRSGQ